MELQEKVVQVTSHIPQVVLWNTVGAAHKLGTGYEEITRMIRKRSKLTLQGVTAAPERLPI